MNYNLFFLILSLVIVVLSIITINTAPIINGVVGNDWGKKNCKKESDLYNYYKDNNDAQKDNQKKVLNKCNRNKAMHDLEYTSFIFDIFLGCFCCILSLLHFFNVGKYCEKITGIIGISLGFIGFIFTFIYIIYSAYIFNNDNDGTDKLYENGAYMKAEGNKYVYLFTEEEYRKDSNVIYAKYKDLGKKQYNYNSELYKQSKDTKSEFYNCRQFSYSGYPYFTSVNYPTNYRYNDISKVCNYLWRDYSSTGNDVNTSISNKYLYDKWLTTIIFGVLIILCALGLAFFGLLIFLNTDSNDQSSQNNQDVKIYSNKDQN